jgi:hypothetical protein
MRNQARLIEARSKDQKDAGSGHPCLETPAKWRGFQSRVKKSKAMQGARFAHKFFALPWNHLGFHGGTLSSKRIELAWE